MMGWASPNFDKPLWLDAPEIRANVALKRLPGIENNGPLSPAQENRPMPERAAMFEVPLGRKKREVRQRLPGLKGRLRGGRLKVEVSKQRADVVRF